jgi:hypothetical protein
MDALEAQRRAFDLYAYVLATLSEPGADRGGVLRHAALDEPAWGRLEDYCLRSVEIESPSGRLDLLVAIGRGIVVFRERLRARARSAASSPARNAVSTGAPTLPTVDVDHLMSTLVTVGAETGAAVGSATVPSASVDPAQAMSTLPSATEPDPPKRPGQE